MDDLGRQGLQNGRQQRSVHSGQGSNQNSEDPLGVLMTLQASLSSVLHGQNQNNQGMNEAQGQSGYNQATLSQIHHLMHNNASGTPNNSGVDQFQALSKERNNSAPDGMVQTQHSNALASASGLNLHGQSGLLNNMFLQNYGQRGGFPQSQTLSQQHENAFLSQAGRSQSNFLTSYNQAGMLPSLSSNTRPDQQFSMNDQSAVLNADFGLSALRANEGNVSDGGKASEPTSFPELIKVPCRARGMALDHNAKTAFFTIPDGTQHGQDLVCSHPVCRDQGVKFQFCAHCQCPVAKRNFRNRHLHIEGGVPPPQPRPLKRRKDEDGSADDQPLTERERRWLNLLDSRPPEDEKEATEKWLAQVMSVSSRKKTKVEENS